MAQSKHPILRVVVPLLVIVGGLALGWGLILNQKSGAPATPPSPPPSSTPPANSPAPAAGQQPGAPTAAQPAPAPAATDPTPPTPTPPTATTPPPANTPSGTQALTDLRAKVQAGAPAALAPLGNAAFDSAKPDAQPYFAELRFDPAGAGVAQLTLARHYTTAGPGAANEVLQSVYSHRLVDNAGALVKETRVVPLALLGIMVNGQFISLADINAGPVWRETAPGSFEAEVVNGAGETLVRIQRRFEIAPGTYDIVVRQSVQNATGAPLNVQLVQLGPSDVPEHLPRYGGDMRRVRVGVVPPGGNGQQVLADRFLWPHAEAVGKPTVIDGQLRWPDFHVWPRDGAEGAQLAFVGLANRYFSVVVHPLPNAQKRTDGLPDKTLRTVERVDRVILDRAPSAEESVRIEQAVLSLRLTGAPVSVAPGQSVDQSFGLYAGPTEERALAADERTRAMQLDRLVLFSMGGPCAFCTFQPIARLLHGVMVFLHDYLFRDWALAVIFLVVCVRTVLHPVTRWSQTNLTRFGKQMAKIGPKQAKLKEKYGHDPKQFQAELAKLMREENVSYAGMLGCIPAVLQTPVWIALYAMINFSFELRHQPAFYGVFQHLTGGKWSFLADMSIPDRCIPFGTAFKLPLGLGTIDSFNLLPILLGVVFYIQQKYLTPPTSTELTPEQETTQKITKVMMVVMFPLFMYTTPAALTLYFLTNSSLAIIESKWIRAHVDRVDAEREKERQAGGGKRPEPAKKGFLARIQERVEEAQRLREQMAREAAKRKK